MYKTPSLNKPYHWISIILLAILSYSTAWANTNNGFTLEQGDLVVEDGTAKATAFIGNFIGAGSVPIGSFTAFLGTNVPENWKEANGESLSRATYPELYAQIGDRYGSDDSLSFNLPDLRGEFIRGWDNGRGVDNGRQLGSYQADGFRNHDHKIWGQDNHAAPSGNSSNEVANVENPTSHFSRVTDTTGISETRPRNIAVMYIIRVK